MKKETIVDFIILILGNVILVTAVAYFIIPFEILSGGMAGIAVALKPILPISEQAIINSIIVITFISGSLVLGKGFVVKTILSTIFYPILLNILLRYPINLDIPKTLASIYAGVLGGIGIGLVLRQGGSTGGMDVPPLIINKFTGIKIGTSILVIDGLTVLLGLWTYGLESVLIGLLSVYTTGLMIDKVLTVGGLPAKTCHIISDHYSEILVKIHQELDRSATIIEAKGGYSGQDKKVLLCVIPAQQYRLLQNIVDGIDKDAFMIVSDTTEVLGEGFSFELENKI